MRKTQRLDHRRGHQVVAKAHEEDQSQPVNLSVPAGPGNVVIWCSAMGGTTHHIARSVAEPARVDDQPRRAVDVVQQRATRRGVYPYI